MFHFVSLGDLGEAYSYKKRFLKTKILPKVITDFYQRVKEWREKGIKVYAFEPPISYNLSQLENNFTSFNWNEFVENFINAGGEWINLKGHFHTYDGSHINKESAIKLSSEVISTVGNKTIMERS